MFEYAVCDEHVLAWHAQRGALLPHPNVITLIFVAPFSRMPAAQHSGIRNRW
jgi:hypothetical protein